MLKKAALLAVIFYLLAASSLAGLLIYLLHPAWVFAGSTGRSGGGESFERHRINIALLGFDRSAARDEQYSIYRPDTIMIASLDLRKRDVSLVNIPRDSYVRIAGTEIYDKINHAYMHGHNRAGEADPHRGGIDTTLRTIEDFLGGVPIHFYVYLEMDGVVEMVDAAGGIDYTVEYPIRADFGRGALLVEQGYQRLDGRSFLHYVRDRSAGGDTGRSRRQQQILLASLKQLKKEARLADLPALYRAWREHTETDLSTLQLTVLALFGMRVNTQAVETFVFPGTVQFAPQGDLDISYIVIDETARVELIGEIFGVSVAARPQVNLPGRRLLAERPAGPPAPSPAKPEPAPGEPPPSEEQAPEPGNRHAGDGSAPGEPDE